MNKWTAVVELEQIPVLGSRLIKTRTQSIAVFRGSDNQVFAINDSCPHKQGSLSQGMMHGTTVTCPLHSWKLNLASGEVLEPDQGCINTYPVNVIEGQVYLQLSPDYLQEAEA